MNQKQTNTLLKDYTHYTLTKREKLLGFIFGSVCCSSALYVVYHVLTISACAFVIGGFIGIKMYRHYLYAKQHKQILLEFKECLNALAIAYTSGKNTFQSFQSVCSDCNVQFGNTSIFAREFDYIIQQMMNGQSLEVLVQQLSDRLPHDVIKQFVIVFNAVYRQGGNLKQLVDTTRRILIQKIDMTLDIQTLLFEQNRQIAILLIMPYVLLLMLDNFGLSTAQTPTIEIVFTRSVSLLCFVSGFFIAKHMVSKLLEAV